jgi:hypothetical protein
MGLLRDSGFSCHEVGLLSGGRWSTDNVRQYGAWSGTPDLGRRDAALGVFAEFASMGYKFEDISGYIDSKKLLDAYNMDFPSLVKIATVIIQNHVPFDKLVAFSDELLEAKKTITELRERMDLDSTLDGLGLTRDLQEKVLKLSRRHGGVNNFSTVLLGHESLQLAEQEEEIVEKEIASMKQEIEVLEASKERLEEENRELSKTVGGYNRELAEISILYNAGWDIGNLTLAGLLTKQWGGVKDIFGGMMKFASLKKIEAKLEAKKAELDGSGASGGVANGKPAPKAKTMEEIIDEIRDSKIDLDNPKK